MHLFQLWKWYEKPGQSILVGVDENSRDEDTSFWLPLSQCEVVQEIRSGGQDFVHVRVPGWLCEKKGLDPSLHAMEDDDETSSDDGFDVIE